MPQTAIQIFLRDIWLDRKVSATRPWVYVVCLARSNLSGTAQVWVSNPPFRLSPRPRPSAGRDKVHGWDGSGMLTFSAPLEGLDSIHLKLFLVRDRSRTRSSGSVLQELFGEGGIAGRGGAASSIVKLAGDLTVVGAVLEVAGAVFDVLGASLAALKDRVLINAEGTLLRSNLMRDREVIPDVISRLGMDWGGSQIGDSGYFHIEVRTSDVHDAAPFTAIPLPPEVEARLRTFEVPAPPAPAGTGGGRRPPAGGGGAGAPSGGGRSEGGVTSPNAGGGQGGNTSSGTGGGNVPPIVEVPNGGQG